MTSYFISLALGSGFTTAVFCIWLLIRYLRWKYPKTTHKIMNIVFIAFTVITLLPAIGYLLRGLFVVYSY